MSTVKIYGCWLWGVFGFFCLVSTIQAQIPQPFKWNAKLTDKSVVVEAEIPPNHYLYVDKTSVLVENGDKKALKADKTPKSVSHDDDLFGKTDIYPAGKARWFFTVSGKPPYEVEVAFQGCRDKGKEGPALCFPPGKKTFSLGEASSSPRIADKTKNVVGKAADSDEKSAGASSIQKVDSLLDSFSFGPVANGYLPPKEFIDYLDQKQVEVSGNDIKKKTGIVLLLFILGGGLLLNLTPCVLPMIPINLAIIGAGSASSTKKSGFARGGVYGAGIAVAYGALGIITVLTGATFGALNATSWFNFGIAVVFIILGLAMFDVYTIDFSKYSSKIDGVSSSPNGKSLIGVFVLGAVSALLAGACVAPVVIAVLIQSSTFYAEGHYWGLLLPLLLGVGMALPWPFAGAGLASLPKPGNWMIWVKKLFGVLIFAAAAYYGYVGYGLMSFSAEKELGGEKQQIQALISGLEQAKREKKPVFIDFWASWCKSCLRMNTVTLKDPNVKEKLSQYVVIKFQAEKPDSPTLKPILKRFDVIGLPTYVTLLPEKRK